MRVWSDRFECVARPRKIRFCTTSHSKELSAQIILCTAHHERCSTRHTILRHLLPNSAALIGTRCCNDSAALANRNNW